MKDLAVITHPRLLSEGGGVGVGVEVDVIFSHTLVFPREVGSVSCICV